MKYSPRVIALVLCVISGRARAQEVTGALREGLYSDTDHTQVIRSLAAVDAAWAVWHLFAKESVDIVTSASLDVRTSPAIDAMSSASSLSMSDRRFETTVGGAFDDGHGHTASVSAVYASERDYTSVGAGLSGSFDLRARTTTLLAGVHANHNDVKSIIDPTFQRTLDELSYSLGIAQVLSPGDALRLRYDGTYLSGYQASPYRSVRFGDWTAEQTGENGALTFTNTLGSADGLPENIPGTRVRHALVGEWLHSLAPDVGLETQVRLTRDSWGVSGATLGADVRYAGDAWQLRAGYRFYVQSAADFFLDKYTQAADMYTYYTSDKELGDQRGHIGSLDIGYAIKDWPTAGHKTQLDAMFDVLHYTYPGFVLLESRNSLFMQAGLRIEF